MLNNKENREKVFGLFPSLINDRGFKIIGHSSPDYNCIAWAANVTDEWWTNLPKDKRPHLFEGVKYNWPFDVNDEFSIDSLIHIFDKLKYKYCEFPDYEEGFKKVAFYELDGKATHAARQLTSGDNKGLWSSKLGRFYLITHESVYSIVNQIYGNPVYYMKKSMN